MAKEMLMEMDKGTYLGKVTLELWENAMPDVDFQPEDGSLENFTWKHITIMKTGLTKAMRTYVHDELVRQRKSEPKEVDKSRAANIQATVQEGDEPDFIEIDKVVAPEPGPSVSMNDITKRPTREDGPPDPDIEEIKKIGKHQPEGVEGSDVEDVRSQAMASTVARLGQEPPAKVEEELKLTPFEVEQNEKKLKKELAKLQKDLDNGKEELVIPDKPKAQKVKARFANSPA